MTFTVIRLLLPRTWPIAAVKILLILFAISVTNISALEVENILTLKTSPTLCKACRQYFSIPIGDQDK